ncbi:hypothetical protein FRB99_005789 [Tulasnella sp. 403]|nr:hypothetical protein FRB99_005789 [Tulasnella sp. 403]
MAWTAPVLPYNNEGPDTSPQANHRTLKDYNIDITELTTSSHGLDDPGQVRLRTLAYNFMQSKDTQSFIQYYHIQFHNPGSPIWDRWTMVMQAKNLRILREKDHKYLVDKMSDFQTALQQEENRMAKEADTEIPPLDDNDLFGKHGVLSRRGLHNSKGGRPQILDTKIAPQSAEDWSTQANQIKEAYGHLDVYGKTIVEPSLTAFDQKARDVFRSLGGAEVSSEVKSPIDVVTIVLNLYDLVGATMRQRLQEPLKAVKRAINLQTERMARSAALKRIILQFNEMPDRERPVRDAANDFVEDGINYVQEARHIPNRPLGYSTSGEWADRVDNVIMKVALVPLREEQRARLKIDFDKILMAAGYDPKNLSAFEKLPEN